MGATAAYPLIMLNLHPALEVINLDTRHSVLALDRKTGYLRSCILCQ